MKKKALITGVTGQDGSYLAEFLLNKKYEVHGVRRRSSIFNTERVDHLFKDPLLYKKTNFYLHYADLTDSASLLRIINKIKPDEIYNLAAQSHVHVSFENPVYTANVDGLGTIRILEIIKELNLIKKTKFYQASSSEMFGKVLSKPQNEKTHFNPVSPYAASKVFSYWITKIYREAYGMYAVNGILFNHESERRGNTFVTKKVTQGLVRVKLGLQKKIVIGNLDAKRDWGHAKDYVEAQWKMLQQKQPTDFVISTGKQYSVRDLVNYVCKILDLKIRWYGKKLNEKGVDIRTKKKIVVVSKNYFRPNEVDNLLGDSKLAKKKLNWKPKITFQKLIKDMVKKELEKLKFYSGKINSE